MKRINPKQLDIFTEPVTDIYIALEDEIFNMIAKRLKTGPKFGKDYVLEWQVDKLRQLSLLNDDTIKALSKTTGIAVVEIEKAIVDTGYGTIKTVDDELKTVYPPLQMPTEIDRIMQSYVEQTFVDFDNFINQTLISTHLGTGTVAQAYQKIIEETTGKVLAGTKTINQALAETVAKWGEKGIATSFVDKGGNTWYLENYARTAIRSTVNRVYNEQRMSRMDEYGVELVVMSSKSAARPACSPIQGKVLDTTETRSNPKYENIYDYGYGEPWGVRGINCGHMFYPFIEGVNENNQLQFDEDEVNEKYEDTQKQRYYERQIRKAKRSLELAKEVGDPATIERYKKLVRGRQLKIREFIAEKDLPRFYDREQIY